MARDRGDFRKLPDINSPEGQWYALPPQIRERIETEGRRRHEYDMRYLDSIGKKFEDLPVGTVLPSGDTVIEDEQGQKIRRAPAPLYLPPLTNNN